MKLLIAALTLSALASAHAQSDVLLEETGGAVVYDSPVIYQSDVTYNAPVVYNAPVFYLMSAACPTLTAASYCPDASSCYPEAGCYDDRSPNVIIVGRGAYRTSWETTPNVLIIGQSQQSRVSLAW